MEPSPKRQCCENMICSRCFHHNCNAECYNCLCCAMMNPVPTEVVQELEPEAEVELELEPEAEAELEPEAEADAELELELDADAESDVDFDNQDFLFEICSTCCGINDACDCQ